MAKPRPKKEQVGIASLQRKNKTTPILIGVGALVAVLLIAAIAVAATSESGDKNAVKTAVEFRPVSITGDALPSEYADSSGKQRTEATGAQAPTLTGQTFTGEPIAIAPSAKAKIAIFFAHWCPHCQNRSALACRLDLAKNASKYPNVEFYGVATGSSPQRPNYPPSSWLKKEKWPTPVLVDDNEFSAASCFWAWFLSVPGCPRQGQQGHQSHKW